jgi:hypothetical protein
VSDPLAVYRKDPDSVLDYGIDWGTEFLDSADTISTSTWTVDSGITVDSTSNDTTTTKIWLSGGTADEEYTATNKIVTADGRTAERSILILVVEK